MNAGSVHLWKKPKQQDLLSIFFLEMIEATIEKYPLSLKLEVRHNFSPYLFIFCYEGSF